MSDTETYPLTIHLEPGEAAVVLEKRFWDHLVRWYTIMAEDTANKAEKENWYSIVAAVREWVEATYFDPEAIEEVVVNEDDDWD